MRRFVSLLVVMAGLVPSIVNAIEPPGPVPRPLATFTLKPSYSVAEEGSPVATAVLMSNPTFKVGRPVAFNAEGSTGTRFIWKISPSDQTLIVGDGRLQAFTWTDDARPFVVEFIAIQEETLDDDRKVITSIDSRIQIVYPAEPAPPKPDIDPVPNPNPTPTPPSPVGTYEATVQGWYNAVGSPTKKDEALKMAVVLEGVASMCDSQPMTAKLILDETSKGFAAALGTSAASWKPFLDGFGSWCTKASQDGLLYGPVAHAGLWRQTATVLRGSAK